MYKGERFNTITHFAGSVAAIIGLIVLVVMASHQGDTLSIVSVTIYGSTLILLYVASTLYHGFRGKAKKVFQKLDYFTIYLLIAGTYTPFVLVTLGEVLGWVIFFLIWGLAIFGILWELFSHKENRLVPLVIYLVMGWIIVIAIKPMIQSLSMAGFGWLLLGGLAYTLGVVFYVYDERVRHFHGIWHLFVLAGSTIQYFTVLYYVL